MGQKILITGASGFIGSHLAETLAGQGHDVTCLLRPTSRRDFLDAGRVRLVVADFFDRSALAAAVRDADYVFHLAGVIRARDWAAYYNGNVRVTRYLLEACLQAGQRLRKFVLVSSISAVGPSVAGTFLDEESPCRPVSDYGRSKWQAEQLALEMHRELPLVIVRPPNVIGPRQQELYRVMRLIRRHLIPSVGNGDLQTSLCYVGDLVNALVRAAESERACGQTYFVTDGRAYGWAEVTAALASALGIRGPTVAIPYSLQYALAWLVEGVAGLTGRASPLSREQIRASRKEYWLYDSRKIARELGFVAAVGMPEAIQLTVEWYRRRNMI